MFHFNKILPFLFVFLVFFGSGEVTAQEKQNHVKITVTPEFTDIRPGETFFIAVKQEIDEGWHTYWHNAGDSGEPPRINWQMPPGFEATEILWPVPKRITAGPLTNHGYEGTAILLQQISAPSDIPEGPIGIKAEIDILVCEEICIPEYHETGFTLNEGRNEINGDIVGEAFEHMPIDVPWESFYSSDEKGDFIIDLAFLQPKFIAAGDKNVHFDILPYEWGIIENTANTKVMLDKESVPHRLILRKQRGERPIVNLGEIKTLITFDVENGSSYGALEIIARPDPAWLASEKEKADLQRAHATQSQEPANKTRQAPPQTGFAKALLFALLGGLILNLMPCVFPVLSMKALSLVKMTEKDPGAARLHGLVYTAGVLASFAAIAGILIVLQAAGSHIGWGFQLQNPVVVLLLSWLLFLIGLNLSGFYEIRGSFTNVGAGLGQKEGVIESFFTGILATIVATPCTAPFMGVAMGYAVTQPAIISMTVFLALGLGLALPYLLLSFFPAMRAILPKPGNWMVVFRELLAFPLYASAVWLIWVYSQQTDAMALLYALTGFVSISFIVWIFRYSPQQKMGKLALRGLAVIVLITVLTMSISESMRQQGMPAAQPSQNAWWQPFTPENYEEALASDNPVFVNMTAAWCITCKVNEKIALDVTSIKELFKSRNVQYLKGDWTNQDPAITNYLSRYGRNGVPLYVFYGAKNKDTGRRPQPQVLPQILTPGIIADKLDWYKGD